VGYRDILVDVHPQPCAHDGRAAIAQLLANIEGEHPEVAPGLDLGGGPDHHVDRAAGA
jgi:hypothetical protein